MAVLEHLAGLPLTWLLVTLLAYRIALWVHAKAGNSPWLHPVAVSIILIVTLLLAAGVDYETYFEGGRYIHVMLGPATVALAVPLYHQLKRLQRDWLGLLSGALLGSAVAVAVAMVLASLLGASQATVLSMAAKSVTMPIAIGLTEKLGGVVSLTSALVMLTGILGGAITQPILALMRIHEPYINGYTLGVVAHGIGTARAIQGGAEMGAFAGLAMGLAGLITAVLVPICLRLAGFL
ncbi:MAG TPA: LrgB family protein [Burkholderiaceae bacterium]|jgi:predicted murein hydrolase (TIGR00659 family)|nr:LrgB family protein [Burkholderiaceae bacterium]